MPCHFVDCIDRSPNEIWSCGDRSPHFGSIAQKHSKIMTLIEFYCLSVAEQKVVLTDYDYAQEQAGTFDLDFETWLESLN